MGFPGDASGKEVTCQCRLDVRDVGYIPGWRSPGVRNGNPLWYSCLENSMDRGTWQSAVHRVTESDTTKATYQSHVFFWSIVAFFFFGHAAQHVES